MIEDGGKKTIRNSISKYLAPEILEEKSIDKAVDIWCIGILLFELLTGSPPFSGDDFFSLRTNQFKLNIKWPKDINVDAKDLILKILKYVPKERLSIEEIINHPFITKYTPNAPKLLIKPVEGVKYESFIISKDDPKTWIPIEIS